MPRSRPLIWIALLAAAFLGYFCLIVYCDIVRPETPGMRLDFKGTDAIIVDVVARSPADRAGLRSGDVLVSVDGRPIDNRLDVEVVGYTVELDRPRLYRVSRGGVTVDALVTVSRADASYFRSREGEVQLAMRLMLLVTLLFGIVIAFARPRDPAALLGALLLASAGVFSVTLPFRLAVMWRALPVAVSVWLVLPLFCTMAIGALVFAFFSIFPSKVGVSGRATLWLLPPVVIVAVAHTATLLRIFYRPGDASGTSFRPYQLVLYLNGGYIFAGLAALVVTYRRLADRTQRRRARVLVAGSLIGWVAVVPMVVQFYRGGADLRQSLFASTGATIGAVFFLAFPISFAYSILRQRLLDLRGIVRLGVQYALARRALLSLVPALGLVLVADLIVHSNRPLTDVVRAHGLVYVVVAAAAAVAQGQRQHWLDALDRRFFRERYNARRVLGQLVADLRKMGSFDQMAPRAAAQIEAALHPRFAAVFVRPAHAAEFRPVAVVPAHRSPRPLPADSTVLRLVRVLRKPMDVGAGEAPGLAAQLPPAEIEWLRDSRIELLVPIVVDDARTEAVLALGLKRSEEPYSAEDEELLVAIAESLAMLLDRAAPPDATAAALAECPSCGSVYGTAVRHCAGDGTALTPTRVPHLLASRYLLERRLGRGSMGTVYAATDTALDRPVAVKVLRDELIGDAAAIFRFHGEARAAARLSHPNIVTVHDFGVAQGNVGFLIMELLDGMSLRSALLDEPRMPPARVVEILRGVTAAIEVAHRAALVHRDLKPENVFLVRRDAAEVSKVVDFGIAKSLTPGGTDGLTQHHTDPGIVVGTPLYMAPEQLRGREPNPSWDLWAVAVIAFETLTGRHPFAGLPPWIGPGFGTGETAVADSPLAALPAPWVPFFARALAVDPALRPASARELIEQFEAAVGP